MTILNTIEYQPVSISGSILIMLAISFVVYTIVTIISMNFADSFAKAIISGIISGIIVIVIMSFIGITLYETLPKIKQIECIISDDTKFKDITNKYYIKDQRGDIYILEEKETESYD